MGRPFLLRIPPGTADPRPSGYLFLATASPTGPPHRPAPLHEQRLTIDEDGDDVS